MRATQAELKHFKEFIRRLEQQDRLIRLNEARRAGRRNHALEMTEREAVFLDSQPQQFFSDWSQSEQERFKAQQAGLWNLIPEKFRAQAEELARGR